MLIPKPNLYDHPEAQICGRHRLWVIDKLKRPNQYFDSDGNCLAAPHKEFFYLQ